MPNRTIYFYDDTYCVIQEKATKKEVSRYINELIRRDQGVNGKPTETVTTGPVSTAKFNPETDMGLLPDVKVKVTGDGLTTCKKCGYLLTTYKGKCKNCG